MARTKDEAEKQTDDLLEELEKRIYEEYETALKGIQDKYEKFAERFAEQEAEKKKLLDDGKITEKEFKEWKQNKIKTDARYKELLDTLAEDLVTVDQKVMSITRGYMPEAYALNFNYETYDIEQNTQINTSFSLYSRETVERLMKDDPDLLPAAREGSETAKKLKENKDLIWNRRHLDSAITQGVLQGKSIPEISKNLQQVTDMDDRAAVRNARTMMTGAQNAGRLDAYERADRMGIKIQKEWMATLDSRTRDSHQRLDGERVDWKKPFSNDLMYPGDSTKDNPSEVYNCRCTMIPFYPEYADIIGGRMTYNEWKNGKENVEKTKLISAEFTPAQSIKEAEEYAQRFLGYNGKVSYSGIDLEYANVCNQVLNDIHANYEVGGLYELQKINFRKKIFQSATTSDACYRWGSGGLYINSNYYKSKKAFEDHKKEIDELMRTVLNNGQMLLNNATNSRKKDYIEALLNTKRQCVAQSHDFVQATIVHECGHMLDDKLFYNKIRKEVNISESMKQFGGNISGYAISDNREYVAETFTAWWYGESDKCDPKIVKVFEETMKK